MTARLIVDVGRLLYIGPIGVVPPHRCPGAVVAVGVDGPIELALDGTLRTLHAATTPAVVLRSVSSDAARVAVTLIDPALAVRTVDDRDAHDLVSMLETLWQGLTRPAWSAYLERLGCLQPTPVPDARVAEAARRLRAASDRRLGSAAVAAGLRLSASRLEHLFAQHIGVPMRSYRRWCRFQAMARAMAAGQSLTAAAHEAGFHDSAHMNRAFRQSFGIVPTFVFRPGLLIDVVEREG